MCITLRKINKNVEFYFAAVCALGINGQPNTVYIVTLQELILKGE